MFAKKLGVDDLCMIGTETNEEITKQLEARLKAEAIYTNIGDVLISVNPFKQLGIYGPDYVQIYSSATTYDNSPHIYALAQNAYSNMMADDSSQAVIISGESGAGKTEAAKLILNYISAVSPGSEASARMKSNIESTNPLLESFGNAKTVRNDNSSRFGKYLEVAFNSNGEPSSGQTLKFLLEKTRVAFQAKGERNFHIFYQLVTGCSDEMREAFGLGGVNDYFYLSQSGVTTVTGVNDSQMFQEVLHAMKVVGISDTDQWRCFQCLAAILHIGNITLEGDPKARVTNADELKWAAYLLSVEEARLEHCIMTRLMASPRGSMYEIPQNAVQATGMRDALAKTLYERVFSWLVECINQAMGGGASSQQARAPPPNPMGRGGAPPPRGRGGFGTSAVAAAAQPISNGINLGNRTIGVLDIYGFEIFEQNGYEQFCINYVNERLQQIFIDLTLKQEQKEYHEEEMKWKDIQFFDNKIVVELIEGKNPPGIFRVLDDVCRTAHAVDSQVADAKFMEKLGKTITSHPHLIMDSQKFTIKHYAGDVTYTIEDFCFKNKDNLFLSIVVGMQTTQEPWIQTLFADADAKQGPPTTSGGDLRNSANQLINRLAQCTGHYVRTIKPNETRSPLTFVTDRVKHQVKYLGLLENVKVKKSGYSYRHYFHNFVERFGRLCAQPPSDTGISGVQQVIAAVTSQPFQGITISRDEFGLGKTKIFVKSPETIFQMSEMLEAKLDPEGYKLKMQEFKKVEKVAMKQKAKTEGLKRKCLIM